MSIGIAVAVAIGLVLLCTEPARRFGKRCKPLPTPFPEETMTATTKPDRPDFASTSLPRHLGRGVVGFGALIGSVALIPVAGPVVLLLLPVGLVDLRGCPMCWVIGLVQTVSRGRLRRSYGDAGAR
ncbi:hypothetical protein [Nocardia sp. X0981]